MIAECTGRGDASASPGPSAPTNAPSTRAAKPGRGSGTFVARVPPTAPRPSPG